MEKGVKTTWTVAGLILLVLVSLVLIWRQAAAPRETISNFNDVPPKGAGRYDR